MNGVERCYEAFERIKNGKPNNKKFVGIPPEKVTASVVSQEAGFDCGYLKRSRANHQAIIAIIDAYSKEQGVSTLSKAEAVRREKKNTERYKAERDEAKRLLSESLAREVLLAMKLKELERFAYNSDILKRLRSDRAE